MTRRLSSGTVSRLAWSAGPEKLIKQMGIGKQAMDLCTNAYTQFLTVKMIRDGVLTGCLTSWYEAQRLRRDPALAEKLGATGTDADRALVPRNGFRFGGAGGRQFDSVPGIAASNVIVEGADALAPDALLERAGDGLYVGRIWYCYAINGLAAGDFTCTVVGDSYMIRDGRLAEPLRANVVRIDDDIVRVLAHVIGVGKETRGTVLWAADEVVYAPAIAVEGVPVNEIGEVD